MIFQNIPGFYAMWLIPVLILAFILARFLRTKALNKLIESELLPQLNTQTCGVRRTWKSIFLVMALALLILAITRPAWNKTKIAMERQGRDVVFILDVSKSMLAEDLKPNRLENAKLMIKDCLTQLRGDRIGLVIFAGEAKTICPLTVDYNFFEQMLSEVGPNSVNRGGTKIGDAIRKTLKDVFDKQNKEYKDIIFITDGEDQDSYPLQAAAEATEDGIRIIAIGLGNDKTGKLISIKDADGNQQTHISRLDSKLLRSMVRATKGGQYFNVGTGFINLGKVYEQLIASAAKRKLAKKEQLRYEEKFQIFLLAAIIFFLLEMSINEQQRKKS